MIRRILHSLAVDVTATAGAVGVTSVAGQLVLPPWLVGLAQVLVLMIGTVNAVRRQNRDIRQHVVRLDAKVTALDDRFDRLERWLREAETTFPPRREDN
jgi:hypothetical protein